MFKILVTTIYGYYQSGASVATTVVEFGTQEEAEVATEKINSYTHDPPSGVVTQTAIFLNPLPE